MIIIVLAKAAGTCLKVLFWRLGELSFSSGSFF
jgi:hypothetical protein